MKVPLKWTEIKLMEKHIDGETKQVTADDIILGKIGIKIELIPAYIEILNSYEKHCAEQARYIEAEMAKHKKEELKMLSVKFDQEKILNNHLKEKVEVEEAYLEEFNMFQ